MNISQFFFAMPYSANQLFLHKVSKIPLKKFLDKLIQSKAESLYISPNIAQFLIHSEVVNWLDR